MSKQSSERKASKSAQVVGRSLDRVVRRLKLDAHNDEAIAVLKVDFLMREYGFTRDPLTKDAEVFSDDLRQLVAEWISWPNPAVEGRTGNGG